MTEHLLVVKAVLSEMVILSSGSKSGKQDAGVWLFVSDFFPKRRLGHSSAGVVALCQSQTTIALHCCFFFFFFNNFTVKAV